MQIDLKNMVETLTNIEQILVDYGDALPQDKNYKAMFICEEILTNLQRHADFEERKSDITLSFSLLEENTLQLIFKDNSKAFNLLDFPDPNINASLEERETGGLGIFLSKKYAKILQYNYENAYNILKVVL
jgi:serine/threonine-protein kinase RsbW